MNALEPVRRFAPYHFIVTFPDRVYPFSSYVDGEWVRWRRSYEHSLAQIQETLGVGRYGMRLGIYRELFHILGAAVVIGGGTILSQLLVGSDRALPLVFLLAMLVITYQEFVLQPRTYQQRFGKGITDWFSWGMPLVAYLLFIVR